MAKKTSAVATVTAKTAPRKRKVAGVVTKRRKSKVTPVRETRVEQILTNIPSELADAKFVRCKETGQVGRIEGWMDPTKYSPRQALVAWVNADYTSIRDADNLELVGEKEAHTSVVLRTLIHSV